MYLKNRDQFEGRIAVTPNDIFRSFFTWCCYEAAGSRLLHLWLSWNATLVLIFFGIKIYDCTFWAVFTYSLILFTSICAGFPVFCVWHKVKKNRLLKSSDILANTVGRVFDLKGNEKGNQWGEVACDLNHELYINEAWNTPYCFYDGKECERLFRIHVIKPYYEFKHKGVPLPFEESKKKGIISAVERYLEVINTKFLDWSQGSGIEIAKYKNKKLPRDFRTNKFTWEVCTFFKGFTVSFIFMLLQIKTLLGIASKRQRYLFYSIENLIDLIILYQLWKSQKPKALSTLYRVKFLAIIKGSTPGSDLTTWDLIAKAMNSYLFEVSAWGTEGYFFDGQDCLQFFDKQIKSLNPNKIKASETASYELLPLISEVLDV